MTFEHKVQLWMVVGTWVTGLATFLAVMTALHLARRGEKVRLKISVGIRQLTRGDGSPGEDHVCFDVTNVGKRPVTIKNIVGWVVGKRNKRRYLDQLLSGPLAQQGPVELTHGQNAKLMASLTAAPNWVRDFKTFLDDTSGRSLKTLRAQVFTSVGKTFEVKPESRLIDWFRGDC